MPKTPLVSIIIVFWNSEDHLPKCLASLAAQTFCDFEIIIINNGSSKKTLDELKGENLRIEHLETNHGFAVANNIGVGLARGEWIALLNTDAYPEPEWLENLLKAAGQNPDFNFFASRQIQYHNPSLLDGAGDEYHISGLAWRRFYGQPAGNYGHEQTEVFSACAAAAMYRREDYLTVGGFDEDWFSYFEDVDLSFRMRLIGGRCLYVPEAVVYHVGSASTGKGGDFSIYYGHRNLVWTFIKNMPGWLLWLFLPVHLLMNIYISFVYSIKGKGKVILKAKLDSLQSLTLLLNKRRYVQSKRTVTVSEIYRVMTKNSLPLLYKSILNTWQTK